MIVYSIAFAVALIAIAEPAQAHTPPFGNTGFWGGVLHPLVVTTHLMSVAGLGLLLGAHERGRATASMIFVLALVAGFVTMMAGLVPRWTEEVVLVSAIITGLWAASGKSTPGIFMAGFAGVLGLAVALDSPPDAISVGVSNWTLAGTGIGAATLLVAVTQAVHRIRTNWIHIAVRVIGTWIATAAILALAMKLFRN